MRENESQAETEVVFTGVIGEGLREPQQGDVLHIRGALVPPHLGPPGNLSDLGSFDGRLLAIETWAEGNCHIWGSAALIAPGLALTAKHVIDEFSEQGHFEGGTYALMAAAIRSSGIDMWSVRNIRMLEACDLAVLEMELTGDIGADHTFNLFEPCARLPEVGRALTMTGFVAGQIAYPIDPEHGVSAEAALGLSAGFVTALYPNGRDSFLLPYPVIEVEAPTVGGMSGGPAFDDSGRLVGIITSSMLPDEDSGIATTYVSIIWPALLTLINPTWPEALYPAEPWRFVDTTVGFMHESWHLRITDDGTIEYRHDQIPEAPAK